MLGFLETKRRIPQATPAGSAGLLSLALCSRHSWLLGVFAHLELGAGSSLSLVTCLAFGNLPKLGTGLVALLVKQ
jgi:hypothetical protein